MAADESLSAGTYDVRLGESLTSHDKNNSLLCTFRYNFAPDSLDKRKDGEVVVEKSGEATVKFASSSTLVKNDEVHLFKGQTAISKENDYLLIYDPESQEFVLEKHVSNFSLKNIRTAKRKNPEPDDESNLHMPMVPPPSSQAQAPSADDDNFSDLESDLLRDLEQS